MVFTNRLYFEHDGIRMYYLTFGEGKPIVFLPGGIKAEIYLPLLTQFPKKYRVIVVDLPGFGDSTLPKTVWGLSDYGSFITTFIHSLQLMDYVLMGHSLGGGVALEVAKHNIDVKRLVLIDPMGIAIEYSLFWFYVKVLFVKTWNDAFYSRRFSKQVFLLNNAYNTFDENISGVPMVLRITNKCIHTTFTAFEKITASTMVLWGREDELFPYANIRAFEKIPTVRTQVIDGNHDWCVLNPTLFLKKVESFIK